MMPRGRRSPAPFPGSLRTRLLLSHVLPVLIVVPLLGLVLVYVIGSRILLPNLLRELGGQAAVIADMAVDRPEIWEDGGLADAFVSRNSREIQASVSLIAPDGTLLASSDDAESAQVGTSLLDPNVSLALSGQSWQGTINNPDPVVDQAVALAPVVDTSNTTLGAVRLVYPLTGFYDRLADLRVLVAAVSLAAIALGALLGLSLATTIARPLRRATDDIDHMATMHRIAPIDETGPSETRMLARAFNTLAERLAAVEESRRQLVANLVHELARPLGAIRAAAQALQDPAAAEDPKLTHELLSGVEGETRRLERLVDDLTGLYQEFTGGLGLACQPLAFGEWLAELLGPWREMAQRRGLAWSATISPDLPIVDADPDRLGQAVGNVISNAIKYTPSGGEIAVETACAGYQVRVSVRDTGPGIPPAEQERIFAPFYRGPRDRRFPQGMGLGLSIARDVVVAHGGTITVDSRPGQGSTFIIALPVRSHLSAVSEL